MMDLRRKQYWKYIDRQKSRCGKFVFVENTPQAAIEEYERDQKLKQQGYRL